MSKYTSKGRSNKPVLLLACLLLFLGSQAMLPAQGGAPKPAKPDWGWLTAIPAFKGMQAKPVNLDALKESLKKKGLFIDWTRGAYFSEDGRYAVVTLSPFDEGDREDTEHGVLIDLKDGVRLTIPLPDGVPEGKGEMSFCAWDSKDPNLYYALFQSEADGPTTAWRVRIGGKVERLHCLEENTGIVTIFPDNRMVIVTTDNTKPPEQRDCYFYQELGGECKRTPLPDPHNYEGGPISPDGKWKALRYPGSWEEWNNDKMHREEVIYIEDIATQIRVPVFSDRQLRFAYPAEYETIDTCVWDWLPDSSALLVESLPWTGGHENKPGPGQIWFVTIQGEARHVSDFPNNVWFSSTSSDYRHWFILVDLQMYVITIPKK